MTEIEINKAFELNARIKAAAQAVQQSLYDMCVSLKEMRDGKHYKAFGYENFEDYTETEVGISRRHAHRYITIIEKLPADFVTPVSQIGVRKLYLLASLSDDDRAQIAAETDLESATVKELEQQIKQLRADRDKAVADKSAAEADSALKADTIAALKRTKQTLDDRITELGSQIKELESRPVEVAVETREVIPPDYVTREAYEQMTEKLQQQREEAETDYLNLKREANKTETELKQEIERLGKELNERSAAPAQTDSTVMFNAYLTSAYDALSRLVEYINGQKNSTYAKKAITLIDSVKTSLGGAE